MVTFKSYKKGSQAVHWTCDGSTTYSIGKSDKKEIGTDIVLHLSKEIHSFVQEQTIKELDDSNITRYNISFFKFYTKQISHCFNQSNRCFST